MDAGLNWFKLVLSWSYAGPKQLAPAQDQRRIRSKKLWIIRKKRKQLHIRLYTFDLFYF